MESELSGFVIIVIYIVCCLLVFIPHLASYVDIHCLYPKDYDVIRKVYEWHWENRIKSTFSSSPCFSILYCP